MMADLRWRRLDFAQNASGLRVGQRVCMSPRAVVRMTPARARRLIGKCGTLVAFSSSLAAWVRWDNLKSCRCISIEYLAPVVPVTPVNPRKEIDVTTEIPLDDNPLNSHYVCVTAAAIAEQAAENEQEGMVLLRAAALLLAFISSHGDTPFGDLDICLDELGRDARQLLAEILSPNETAQSKERFR